ncbi:MAG: DegQ family serine endoprotease [Candidatus Schekmanbacteria bacterium]|nr:DegQ family serine endoprotease [Candidatus Schekmanbacteria bacterium]
MKSKSKIYLNTLLTVSLLTLTACPEKKGGFWQESKKKTQMPSTLTPETFIKIAGEQKPAVVNISTTRTVKEDPHMMSPLMPPGHPRSGGQGRGGANPFEDFFEKFFGFIPNHEFKQKSLGSGFIINKEGYIITNAHVVENVDEISVTLSNKKEFTAKVVGADSKIDVALIKIDSWKDLPVVTLGDSDALQVGEWVLAVGNPFGLEHTVTSGIVSAKGRVIGSGPYDDFIQTDASINPGNSGGPLFNLRGEVVGISTAIVPEGQGIGFVLPINMAKDVLNDLRDKGSVTRGWLGVVIQKVTPGIAGSFGLEEPIGALISQVLPDSPAAAAGLKQGDIVTKFNGKTLEDYNQLSRMAAKTPPDTKIKLEVIRNGKAETVSVTLGTYPKDERMAFMPHKIASRLGMRVENVTRQLKDYFNLKDESGVVITDVEENSPATEAEITAGTIILEVNRKPVPNIEVYQSLISEAKSKETVLLLVKQAEHTRYVTLSVP